jgi:transposase
MREEPVVKDHSINWVGIDDSADKLNVAILEGDQDKPREEFEVVFEEAGMGRLVKRLKSLRGQVRCVYEAGPCGYVLYRHLKSKGIECMVAAPSLTPRRAGERVKTNRLDARKLARYLRSGELTAVRVPDDKQEGLRDLLRAREDALEDLTRQRHRLSRFLLRNGRRFRGGKAWTKAHWVWLRSQKMEQELKEDVLGEYRRAAEEAEERMKLFDLKVETAAGWPEYAEPVKRLMSLRGVKEITAMTILAEAVDLKRYGKASSLMMAVGLVSSENSTGESERRGPITKTGNAHLRRVLIESAWHYRHMSVSSRASRRRRQGLPAEVVEIARKADRRLHRKYWRLVAKGKRPVIAATAVARELAGFIWAIGQVA